MIVDTTRFGPIEVDPSHIISIPQGLIGIPSSRRFILLDHDTDGPFKWLQSIDEPSLAFVVVDPYLFFRDYEVLVPDEKVVSLGILGPEDVQVLAIVTIRPSPFEVTANLLGPVVIGLDSLCAVQLVLSDDRYSTRHPLPLINRRPLKEARNEVGEPIVLTA